MNYFFPLSIDHLAELGHVNVVNSFIVFYSADSDPDRYLFLFLNKPESGNVNDHCHLKSPGLVGVPIRF